MILYLKKQLFIAAMLYIGSIGLGYSVGWTAPVVPKLQNPEQSPIPLLSTTDVSWIVSISFPGAIIGANIAGMLSNTKGRKPSLQSGGVILMLSFLILALSVNLPMVAVGRLLNGTGVSFIHTVSMVYIAEIATTNIRGILLTATNVFFAIGTLSAYGIGPYVSYAATGYIGFTIALAFSLGTLFIPESPVFNVLEGKGTEAKDTLLQLGRANDVEEVLATKLVGKPKTRKQEWQELFCIKTNRKSLFLSLALHIFQQASGGVSILFFSTSIFQLVDSSLDPSVSTIITGVTQLLASFGTPIFIERLGRKGLLMVSTGVCSFSSASLGAYFYLDSIGSSASDGLKWLPLASVVIFLLSYTLGFCILPEAYMGEILESNVRAPGSAFTLTISWIVGFACTSIYGYLITVLGGYITFWMYSGVCAIAFIFITIFVPETKGMSLVEIQYMLSK